jgi:uncharacterized protein YceK
MAVGFCGGNSTGSQRFGEIMKWVFPLFVGAMLLSGCDSLIEHFDGKAQYYAHKVIIHDMDYDTYLTDNNEWSDKKSQAKSGCIMTHSVGSKIKRKTTK